MANNNYNNADEFFNDQGQIYNDPGEYDASLLNNFDFDALWNGESPGYQALANVHVSTQYAYQYPDPEEMPNSNPVLASVPKNKTPSPLATKAFSPRVSIPSPQMRREPYFNSILNSFPNPVIPLRILDKVLHPFKPDVYKALVSELEKQRGSARTSATTTTQRHIRSHCHEHLTAQNQSPVSVASAVSLTKRRRRRSGGNKRPSNIRAFNSSKYYEPLPKTPDTWGKLDPATLEPAFRYNKHGELLGMLKYQPDQIIEYLKHHPLHRDPTTGRWDTKNSGLILWIQTVPADSGKRYGEQNSDKCRYAWCPDSLRTIRKGDFRVAFDEQYAHSGTTHDPFHVAGYVHLSCLERFVDFPILCKEFNVRPDTRIQLPEGKSKMAVIRDHPEMEEVVKNFIQNSKGWTELGGRPRDFYNYTLNYMLTAEHLSRQPSHLAEVREKRGGNHIGIHMNNLEKWVELQRQTKEQKKNVTHSGRKRKRKRGQEDTDDEDELDPAWTQGGPGGLSPRAIRASKRAARSSGYIA